MGQITKLDEGINWKTLQKTLQNIQKAINRNCPVRGEGIQVHETETGSVISIDPKTSDDSNNIMDGQWITVDVMDQNCNRSTILVWGIPSGK